MKNMFKAIICTLTLTAAITALPAMVSARDNKDVYISDSYALILREQADEDAPITLYAEGCGYELHIQDYLNGFGYAYVPCFDANGWVDLSDTYYDGVYDINGIVVYEEDSCYDSFVQTRYSQVESGFLALRNAPAYDDANIIAEIWSNGTMLQMTGERSGNYARCYVPAFGMYGWVDVRFTV